MGIVRQCLYFNGVSSEDFGLFISGRGTYTAPVREREFIDVPGRNGQLTIDSGRFSNIDVTYEDCFLISKSHHDTWSALGHFLPDELNHRLESIRSWLLSPVGYVRLEDTYRPDEYRLAVYDDDFDPDIEDSLEAATFDLKFNCKPERWLKSGENTITLTETSSILNPTAFASKPLVRAYGTGSFTIGDVTVTISSASTYTDIDCEILEAYEGSTNCNSNISIDSDDFPTLPGGLSTVTIDSLTKLIITPRWWTI